MKLNLISAAVLALGLLGTAAQAASIREMEAMYSPFFTDAAMTTMKSHDEMMKTFSAMTPEQQTAAKAACATNSSPRFQDLCAEMAKM